MKTKFKIAVTVLLTIVCSNSFASDDEKTQLFNVYRQLSIDSAELGEIIKAATPEQYNRAKTEARCSLESLGTNSAQNSYEKMNEASKCVKSIKFHLAKILSKEYN